MKTKEIILVLCLAFLLIAFAEKTKSVSIEWGPNASQNIGDIIGYNFHYGTKPGVYHTILDMGDNLSFQVPNLADSVYFAAMTAYDSVGNRSDFSNEVIVDFEDPLAPIIKKITIEIEYE